MSTTLPRYANFNRRSHRSLQRRKCMPIYSDKSNCTFRILTTLAKPLIPGLSVYLHKTAVTRRTSPLIICVLIALAHWDAVFCLRTFAFTCPAGLRNSKSDTHSCFLNTLMKTMNADPFGHINSDTDRHQGTCCICHFTYVCISNPCIFTLLNSL